MIQKTKTNNSSDKREVFIQRKKEKGKGKYKQNSIHMDGDVEVKCIHPLCWGNECVYFLIIYITLCTGCTNGQCSFLCRSLRGRIQTSVFTLAPLSCGMTLIKWLMTLSVGVPSLSVSSVKELLVYSLLMTWKNASLNSR